MRSVIKIVRRVVIGLGLTALVLVLFPSQIEPLWAWTTNVSTSVGVDSFPPFSRAKDGAGLGLLVLALGGVVYNAWRERCLEVLRAEYEYGTGASQLKQQIKILSRELERVTGERDRWQQEHANLNKEHTAILVTAKEHEVHSKYGREDRATLQEIRTQLNELLLQKGHTQGFREAIEVMMAHLANHADMPTPAASPSLAVATNNGTRETNQQRPPLSFQP